MAIKPEGHHISVRTVNFIGAVIFTVGCSVLVVNAVLCFIPYTLPDQQDVQPSMTIVYVEAALSLTSTLLFLVGSGFAFIQAINTSMAPQWDLTQKNESRRNLSEKSKEKESQEQSTSFDPVEPPPEYSVADPTAPPAYQREPGPDDVESQQPDIDKETGSFEVYWRFYPTSYELVHYYLHSIGFVATLLFAFCSFLYLITAISSIVSLIHMGSIARWIRYPQLVAASGFAIASLTLMQQAQDRWWKPALHLLRWYVHLFNLAGSCGFIFCAVFGLIEGVYWAKYQFGLSYLWGSWAFLFASAMQYYKSLDKRPLRCLKVWG